MADTWRERLRAATFRGVPFLIESTDADLGRRVEILRFPGREDVVGQDLGKDAASFTVNGYVIGADYDVQRQALEAALLAEGPGTLVHPTRGELLVIVHDRVRFRESRDKGGYASVTFQCTVSQPQAPRFVTTSAAASAMALADDATTAASEDSVKDLVTSGLPASAVASQLTLLEQIGTALGTARGTINAIVANVASVVSAEAQIAADAEALLAAPATLATVFANAFYDIFEDAAALVTQTTRIGTLDYDSSQIVVRRRITRTVRQAMAVVMAGSSSTAIDTTTPIVEQETRNLRALDASFRAAALAAYCHALVSLPWSSYQEAQEAKVELLAWFDTLEESVGDATYQALRDLRVAVSAQLDIVARSLPYLRTYSPAVETCALLIALELYGDARRESEIVARNNLRDPSNIRPSDVLEVASA